MKKKCSKCKEVLDIELFHNNSKTKDGKYCQCKFCCKEARDKNRQNPIYLEKYYKRIKELWQDKKINNPEYYYNYLKTKKEYRNNNRQKYLFLSCKNRAKELNLDFNLEVTDIIIPKYCPILEVELINEESMKNFYSPSVDRIKPNLGYIKGNIRVISRKANIMKNNANSLELEKFAKNIITYINDIKK